MTAVAIPSRIATDADQFEFDNAYWAAQPPIVRSLRDEQDADKRKMIGALLADYNYRIDNAIMVWGWDPYNVMKLRLSFGYTWTPLAQQSPVQMAPGLSMPGTLVPYDPKVPTPHAFKVSLDFADYPPFQA